MLNPALIKSGLIHSIPLTKAPSLRRGFVFLRTEGADFKTMVSSGRKTRFKTCPRNLTPQALGGLAKMGLEAEMEFKSRNRRSRRSGEQKRKALPLL
jgi:hypothetical protein